MTAWQVTKWHSMCTPMRPIVKLLWARYITIFTSSDLMTTVEHWASRRPDCIPPFTCAMCIVFSRPTTSISRSPTSAAPTLYLLTLCHWNLCTTTILREYYKNTNNYKSTASHNSRLVHFQVTTVDKLFTHVYTHIAKFAGHLPHRYGNSRAIWDHTRQRWHSRLYPSQSWYSIKWPRRDARLSWPSWLVTAQDGIPARRRSPIPVVTGPDVR